MTTEQLGKNAFIAELHSRNLNVPRTWKKLITKNNLFNWTKFSNSPDIQLIQLKHVLINLNKYDKNKLFSPEKNIYNDNIFTSFEEALNHFNE